MIGRTHPGVSLLRPAWLFLFLAGGLGAQGHSSALPRFEDYHVSEIFTGTPAGPKLVTPLEQKATPIKSGTAWRRGMGYSAITKSNQVQILPGT